MEGRSLGVGVEAGPLGPAWDGAGRRGDHRPGRGRTKGRVWSPARRGVHPGTGVTDRARADADGSRVGGPGTAQPVRSAVSSATFSALRAVSWRYAGWSTTSVAPRPHAATCSAVKAKWT